MEIKVIIYISAFVIGLVNAACSGLYGQCGGKNFNGNTCCISGTTCKYYNDWYSQCVPGAGSGSTTTIKKTTTTTTTKTSQPTQSAAKVGKVHIAGDSTCDGTMANSGKTTGWGKYLGNYLTIPVNNMAKAGRSARTFWREGRWTSLINAVNKGDYVFIQFGHNDGGGATHEKGRGSVFGTGDETETVKLSDGTTEVVHTFPWYLRQMVKQVKDKGAIPVLLTLTPTNSFTNGKIGSPNRFADYSKMVAKEFGILCIDHYNYIARQYESLGENYLKTNNWFPVDYLHTAPAAADFNAKILVNAFSRCNKIDALAAVLNDEGKKLNYQCKL